MNKFSTDKAPKQLSLFPFETPTGKLDKRPLPLQVADKWGFALAYVDQDGNADNYLYAGQDWFMGLGGSRSRWSRTKNELLLSTQQLPYIATDGKTYQVDFVSQGDLYAIAMEMRLTAKRPQLAEIRDYLRDAGVLVDKINRDPQWAVARIQGIDSRKQFAAALATCVINLSPNGIAVATNLVYEGLFHRTAAELKSQLQTNEPRNKMTEGALYITGLCEWLCSQKIVGAGRPTETEAREIIRIIAAMQGLQVQAIEAELGIDLVTGQRLLTGTDAIRGA